MKQRRAAVIVDAKVSVRVALSGLWTSIMFVFAYVDIFGFWRADVIRGAIDAKVPGSGFRIDQALLLLTTLYVLVPSLMIAATLLAPARIARPANVVVSVAYLFSIIAAAIGDSWAYYLVGSVVESVLLIVVARVAWAWPRPINGAAHPSGGTSTGSGGAEHAPDVATNLATGADDRAHSESGIGSGLLIILRVPVHRHHRVGLTTILMTREDLRPGDTTVRDASMRAQHVLRKHQLAKLREATCRSVTRDDRWLLARARRPRSVTDDARHTHRGSCRSGADRAASWSRSLPPARCAWTCRTPSRVWAIASGLACRFSHHAGSAASHPFIAIVTRLPSSSR